uniref:Pollen-specific leucine-rich repeat extensin-like protein 1 n=1 Tax=Mesocestoides corti TaxID=53468 RepID=A0A5K3FCX0_MESCO
MNDCKSCSVTGAGEGTPPIVFSNVVVKIPQASLKVTCDERIAYDQRSSVKPKPVKPKKKKTCICKRICCRKQKSKKTPTEKPSSDSHRIPDHGGATEPQRSPTEKPDADSHKTPRHEE